MMRLPVVIAALLLAATACRQADDSALFRLRSAEETGIAFANRLQEDDSVYNPLNFDYLYNGAGVAVGDVNNDGRPDIYFAGNMVSSRLYLNEGDLTFADVTEAAGVGTNGWATGVSMVDVNGDGLLDIYVCVAGKVDPAERANLLFINGGLDENGAPRFVERAAEYGLADTGYSTHAVFFDYDLDGDLDVYLLTNALEEFSRNLIRPKKIDGEAASTDRLYRNDGGSFTDVSREAGILIEGYGLGVVVSDINRDGWPDVYVANDFHSNDLIWVNNQDGSFTNRAGEYLKHQSHNGMGVDVADINNDALVDVVVLDMLPEDNYRQKMMLSGSNYDKLKMSLRYGYQPQYMRNTLQLNNGPGPIDDSPSFSEIGQYAGVHNTDWSWAALLADFDNDGFRDLFVSNGYRRDVTNLDFIVYSQETGQLAPAERQAALFQAMRELPEVKIPNYIYRNRGDLTFEDRSEEWGVQIPSFSNGAAYADLDGDGDLDLVVNNLDDPAFVLENRSERLGRNHLRLVFDGPAGNRAGFGAKVVVHAGGQRQYDDHTPYRGYKSTVEGAVHFGLGAATRVDSLEVFWPDGAYQLLTDVEANRVVTVAHADAAPAAAPREVRRLALLFAPARQVQGLDHVHQERELVDFKVTPLQPHKLSAGGPGIAIGDVDGNGLDDVYIGSDRGMVKEIHLQTAPGTFATRLISEEDLAYEDMGSLLFDADGDGDLDLYVVSGGGFPGDVDYQDRLYLNDGRGGLTRDADALPPITASGSAVVAADYDRDGDLDLFVGGRVVPGRYPLPARSYLLRNDSEPGGRARFTDVTETFAPELAEVGLVTSALWTDYDGDGQIDLLVTGEWMPLTFFRNEGGSFVDATASTGLGETHGWWNSVAAADFDDDGDVDYVVGNRGLNSAYTASADEPMRVHAADFDGNGSVDPVLSRYIAGESYPVASRDILIDQMIPMKGRFPRYAKYAEATLAETLSAEEMGRAYVARSVNFASSYLENLGGGKFAIRPLPARAQFAPVYGMLPGDYDGDGDLDVLLVGNSYAPEVQSGWFDASIGTILIGDGQGGFRAESGSETGFYVDGDAKAIARISLGGGRSAVLVTQNGDSLRAFSASSRPHRVLELQPGDAFARVTLADGSTRRVEFNYGSGYLSQSSRYFELPANTREVIVYDFSGVSRTENPPVLRDDS